MTPVDDNALRTTYLTNSAYYIRRHTRNDGEDNYDSVVISLALLTGKAQLGGSRQYTCRIDVRILMFQTVLERWLKDVSKDFRYK